MNETLLGDLRGGGCSSTLCKQLRSVAADEIDRTEAAFQGVMKDNADLASDIRKLDTKLLDDLSTIQSLGVEIERLKKELKHAWDTAKATDAERIAMLKVIQRHQPTGSPPPGGGDLLTQWVLETLAAQRDGYLRALAAQESLIQECEFLLRELLNEDGVDMGFDDRLEEYWKRRRPDWRSGTLGLPAASSPAERHIPPREIPEDPDDVAAREHLERLEAVAVASRAFSRSASSVVLEGLKKDEVIVSDTALCALESALDAAGMGMTDEEVDAAP